MAHVRSGSKAPQKVLGERHGDGDGGGDVGDDNGLGKRFGWSPRVGLQASQSAGLKLRGRSNGIIRKSPVVLGSQR